MTPPTPTTASAKPYGAWLPLTGLTAAATRNIALQVEAAGFGSIWFPETLTSKEAFTHAAVILAATDEITVGTGIANAWARDPAAARAAAHTVAEAYPGRFILGLGVGHAGPNQARGLSYAKPLAFMDAYLASMHDLPAVEPRPTVEAPVVIAALRPRMQELAGTRADGIHSFCTTPAHTAAARERLTESQLLFPEQAFVIDDDQDVALEVARAHIASRLALPNYRNSFLAMGFSDADLEDRGSDRLVRELVAVGTPDQVADRLAAHLEAGATQVLSHPLVMGEDGGLSQLQLLAPSLRLA